MRERDLSPNSPRVVRPLVGRHPRTGRSVLNANEMHTDRVVGLDPDESEALLAEVYAFLYADANVYRHEWQVGDLVLWDNIAVHHGRPAFPTSEERTLQRVVMHTKTPDEMVPNLAELLA
jgi:taurine dioxygenase